MRCKSLLFALLIFSWISPAWATQDLLPQVQNRWDGQWLAVVDEGERFYRLQTSEAFSPSFLEYKAPQPLSFEGKHIRLQIRINRFEAWGGLEFRVSSDADYRNYYAVPIPFYSDPEFNIIQPGQWADYTLTLGEAKRVGKPDRKRIRYIGIYVQGANTPIDERFTVDLGRLSLEPSLHDGLVSMTFDDGYAEQFQAAEIMNRHKLRGTAYVMTNELNQAGYLTDQNLQTMGKDFGWGISAHHAKPITEMSEKEFMAEMEKSFTYLEKLGFGAERLHFAYPLGKQDRQKTLPWAEASFLSARVAGGGAETLPPSDWLMLKTFNVTPDLSAEEVLERVKLAKENKEWLILMFHMFTNEQNPENLLVYPLSEFEKLCAGLAKAGLPVHPVHEVYEAFHE